MMVWERLWTPARNLAHGQDDLCRLTREYLITPSLRDGLLFLCIPGTSCLATIVQSLRDKEDKPRLS